MKTTHRYFAAGIGLLAILTAWAADRAGAWKEVDEAMKKGLPKTAIEKLEPIIRDAMAEKAWPEAIKAVARKIALEGNIEGNKPEEKIVRLEAEIAKAPAEMKPVMEAVLAHWYWHYFQQNRWRFVQRTQTAEPAGADIEAWDLPRILAEIDRHFRAALAAEKELQAIPVAQYDALLEKGTVPDAWRPTLFDFVAHEALSFYQAGEQAGSRAEDAFDLEASSPVFAPAADFLKWEPDTADQDSATVRAIRLYQKLLAFHRNDADRSAFIDADLARLTFGYNAAAGEGKDERYIDALTRLADEWADHELSARARAAWAAVVQAQGDLVAALAIARQVAGAFPNALGGRECHNIVQEILAKEISVATERVWNAPWPDVRVSYRNLTQVWFRAVPWDFEQRLKSRSWDPESIDGNLEKALLAAKPALEWSAPLPETGDYRRRTEALTAPKDLRPGFYYILASADATFRESENQVSAAAVWVSDLAIVLRTRGGQSEVGGLVAKAGTGEPVEGAEVRLWIRQDRGGHVPGPAAKTDKDGLFRFPGIADKSVRAVVKFGDEGLASEEAWSYANQPDRVDEQTVFFTDRSLYRPGQTVQYKGLCIRVDREQDRYETIAGRTLKVVFQDVNGQEIERQSHKSNAYGSFAGSFTAPRDRLAGRMTIRVEAGPGGAASVSVEEYKRPKFQVALDAPGEAAKLGAKVELKGKATAYTGAAIGGAKVRWRVTRGVEYPVWWHWFCWWGAPSGETQEIARGTAVTEADGRFAVAFFAKPDLSVAESDEPTFAFTVHADVTDTTGETRSSERALRAGYTALQAALSANDWQAAGQAVEIGVRTTTLDGGGQAAKGVVRICALKQPAKASRPSLLEREPQPFLRNRRGGSAAGGAKTEPPPADPANPNSWALGDVVAEKPFATDASGSQTLSFDLKAGLYRAVLETRDRFGKAVTARLPVQVVDVKSGRFAVKIAHHLASPAWSVEPGGTFLALWGTGYDAGRAYVEVEHRGRILKAFWTEAGKTQEVYEQAVGEEFRGGFTFRVTYVRENRAYCESRRVDVPWSNKRLDVKWERFVSKLEPGKKETWTAVVSGPDAKRAVAEVVAGLYDASLDAYLPHSWIRGIGGFRIDQSPLQCGFANNGQGFSHICGNWRGDHKDASFAYRSFPAELIANLWGYGYFGGKGRGRGLFLRGALMAPGAPTMSLNGMAARDGEMLEASLSDAVAAAPAAKAAAMADEKGEDAGGFGVGSVPAPSPDLDKVSARKNLQETAFFFPHLVSDADGVVRIEFTMPEALTEWKFMALAHDRELRSGYLEDKAVTSKDLMVEPNPPRFVREGDELEFTVKVSNQSAAAQKGTVRLAFADARTLADASASLGLKKLDQSFDIPSKESRSFSWRLRVPDDLGFLTYKAVGSTGRLSDGEEGYLPVLSRRILVTESLPLPVRGAQTKTFRFDKLLASGQSDTLRSQSLTVQMVSQPAWYAVMALPYLMEYPYECTEQTFNRLYANVLARHIAASDPKIRHVFDQWRGTVALDSPMEKNEDLKAVALMDTPWVRQAQDESRARKNVGILFDDNRLNDETARLLRKLAEQQLGDGQWPWFPGGRGNDYITLYIATGFGRLRHLGAQVDVSSAVKALTSLDAWIDRTYRDILKHGDKGRNHLSPTIALYLYGRSFFLEDQAIDAKHREAVDYFLGQARTYWLELANRQSQGHLALALKRFGDAATAAGIVASIKERSVSSEEMGMFWRDTEFSWWWYRAPIETQAMMIEALDEVAGDAAAVEACRVWLLKQKQTQDWKTTKATADAIYGLLLRGANLLASDARVEVSLGGAAVKPEKVEAGTGFYEERFQRGEIRPEQGTIVVKKTDEGVSWGSVHWQYLEDAAKVTPHEGTPLTLKKALFVKENTKKGPVLKAVDGPVAVGDELVVRIELRTDRDLEYVHLKDARGSGVEPVNVLSQYRYQDGLAYYESTKDTASHFFIDYLPKGVYVFEYSARVVHKGRYQSGMAEIQCMYAPEFNSHSGSVEIEAR